MTATNHITNAQGLALIGAEHGDLSWCNPRTIRALHDRGWIVYLGNGTEHWRPTRERTYRLTPAGEAALAQFKAERPS